MKAKGNKKGNHTFRHNPSLQIMLITLITMLIAIGGMLFLSINQSVVSEKYTVIVRYDVVNKEQISKISQELHEHQSLIFRYIADIEGNESREELKERADKLQNSIEQSLSVFCDSVNGTEYEPYYHSIYTDLNGYFSNISNVYYFTESGDSLTANYYMNTSLNSYISNVNEEIKKFDTTMSDDLGDSENDMALHIDIAETSALSLILLVITLSVFTLIKCFKISDYMVNKDPLTLTDNYEKMKKNCLRLSKQGTISEYSGFFCNIKDFQFFNQSYGSRTGDTILTEYASALSGFLNKDEYIARNGGDNFIVLIKNGREDKFISFLSDVEINISTEGTVKSLSLNSRSGIYKIRANDTPGDIFNACNTALSATRIENASDFIWYEDNMLDDISRRKELIRQCRDALREHEFIVYYQPKVDMNSSTLCGCEALVRWLHEGSLISPGRFIPAMESEGKITELDFYVFRQVCSDIREWQKKGIKPVRISSNFSKNHLHDPMFARKITDIMDEYGVSSEYIEIELTESSAYEDFKALTDFVHKMKEKNIHTSMDDFGTGSSSLSLLKDLDVDVIKIDKSFIDDLDNGDKAHEKMVENVVHMILDLDREVICEGVETEKQAQFLRSINCNTAQGYLYDKPLAHAEFEKRLSSPVYN